MAKGKYHEWLEKDNLIRLAAWARNGLTYEQIAHNIGINNATLCEWRTRFPEIDKALKRGREVVDFEVENALHKRAMGYSYTEKVYDRKVDKETGEVEMVLTKEYVKHVPPDVTAQIFWLKNRKPEEWRDRKDVAVTDDKETGVALLAPVMEENDGKMEADSRN